MKKKFLVAALLLLFLGCYLHTRGGNQPDARLLQSARQAYSAQQHHVANRRYLTLIDYRRSMLQQRLWVVDLKTNRVVLSSRVSHAFLSGLLYASAFSNTNGSNKSCIGSFITLAPYTGSFGYSLRIQGITPGVNTNAKSRAIIFHADPGFQWSKGCFMTKSSVNARLIQLIKNGSLVYVVK